MQAAIASALGQGAAEVVVVDDGSSAGNAERIAEIVSLFSSVELVRLSANQGVSFARNTGLKRASGDYVVFLDDDDLLEEGQLGKAIQYLEAHQEDDVYISKTILFTDEPGSSGYKRVSRYHQRLQAAYHHTSVQDAAYFLIYTPAIHAVVFRRQVFQVFSWDEQLRYGEDRFLLMSMRAKGVGFHVSGDIGARYRIHAKRMPIPPEEQLAFVKKVEKSGMLRSRFERAYLRVLKAYFLARAKRYPSALWAALTSLTSIGAATGAVQRYLHSRGMGVS